MFQTALELAEGAFAEAQIRGKLGELDFKRGDMAERRVAIRRGLAAAGKTRPANGRRLRRSCSCGRRSSRPPTRCSLACSSAGDNATPSKSELLRLRLLSRLAYAYWFTRGKLQTFLVHLLGMNLAERYAADARNWPTSTPRTPWP